MHQLFPEISSMLVPGGIFVLCSEITTLLYVLG